MLSDLDQFLLHDSIRIEHDQNVDEWKRDFDQKLFDDCEKALATFDGKVPQAIRLDTSPEAVILEFAEQVQRIFLAFSGMLGENESGSSSKEHVMKLVILMDEFLQDSQQGANTVAGYTLSTDLFSVPQNTKA